MADFLFQLEVEEVPAFSVRPILQQVEARFREKLEESLLEFGKIETAATNRRFMVFISNLKETAAIKETTILGPAKNIALDSRGLPQVALQKFIETNKFRLADVVEIETPKGIYMGVIRIKGGEEAEEIFQLIIPEILSGLNLPKTMVWNESRVPFIRPIRNILVMFKNKLIDLEYAGVRSSQKVNGHLLLSFEYFLAGTYVEYMQGLLKNFVMLGEEERKQKILGEFKDIEEEFEVNVPVPDEMLEYYLYSNEYPVVFSGSFQNKYLSLPPEIITSFMKSEKKLLPVYNKDGKLKNMFAGVANIPDETKNVSRGFEKVIQATFEDAQFFWDMDLRDDFYSLRIHLKNVLFHKELGNYYEKSERLATLVEALANETNRQVLKDKLIKAAQNCKNDLITRMVREFPMMQGVMGGLYLMEKGEDQTIWKAIYGQYLPKGFSDELVDDPGAGLLSICDRIDNITGFLSKGIRQSGSKDPYGLRRDGNAVVKIIINFGFDFDLTRLIEKAAGLFLKDVTAQAQLVKQVQELFHIRIENCLRENLKIRYDAVSAVLQKDTLNIQELVLRARAVDQIAADASVSSLISLHKRLRNIIKKQEFLPFSEDLLQQQEEKVLFDVFKESKGGIEESIMQRDFLKAISSIMEMKPIIDLFFEKVLIMADDVQLKNNRIALLQRINEVLLKIADFSVIQESNTGDKDERNSQ